MRTLKPRPHTQPGLPIFPDRSSQLKFLWRLRAPAADQDDHPSADAGARSVAETVRPGPSDRVAR